MVNPLPATVAIRCILSPLHVSLFYSPISKRRFLGLKLFFLADKGQFLVGFYLSCSKQIPKSHFFQEELSKFLHFNLTPLIPTDLCQLIPNPAYTLIPHASRQILTPICSSVLFRLLLFMLLHALLCLSILRDSTSGEQEHLFNYSAQTSALL